MPEKKKNTDTKSSLDLASPRLRGFGSDNHAPVHPLIFRSIENANQNHAPSYGTDELTELSYKTFRSHFGQDTQIYYVFNGTAANVLALRIITQGFESILCSEHAHIHQDECAAPEALAHVKIIPVPSKDGKLSVSDLKRYVVRKGDQHFSQIRAVSITQPTELGTVYSVEEIKEICDWAHSENLWVHMDGARLPNAAAHLNVSLLELTRTPGVDIVSYGGTKNGFLFGEAVLVLNSQIQSPVKFFRKQICQLPSKTRFISAQFQATLGSDLWKEIAQSQIEKAQYLFEKLKTVSEIQITQKVQSNAVFSIIPKAWIKPLREKFFFYIWNEKTFECRLMISWDTQFSDLDDFYQICNNLSKKGNS